MSTPTGTGARAIVIERVLTARQQEYVALTWRGMSNKQIAARLQVTTKAVKETLRQVNRRLGIVSASKADTSRVKAACWLWHACERQAGRR